MTNQPLPQTVSTEYRDVSTLLSVLAHGIETGDSFYLTALSAFGLAYSAFPANTEALLNQLINQIAATISDSEIIAQDVEALGYAAHVVRRYHRLDGRFEEHRPALEAFFERVSNLQWLRSPAVAVAFLLGFAGEGSFLPLIAKAHEYLLQQPTDSLGPNLPLVLFGQTILKEKPSIGDPQIQAWLNRTQQPFKHLCLLAIALNELEHPLATVAVARLRDRVVEMHSVTVDPNISLIRVLLAVVHLAQMGEDGDQITEALDRLPIGDDTRSQISAVIRADSHLFVELRDEMLTDPPAIDLLSHYLFAASKLGLRDAYIVDDSLKTHFTVFLATWQHRQVRAINRNALAWLIAISSLFSIAALVSVWWPLSNWLYSWILQRSSSALVQSYLDDLLKAVILFPIYIVVGSALALWLRGQVALTDINPEGVTANVRAFVSQLLRRSDRQR